MGPTLPTRSQEDRIRGTVQQFLNKVSPDNISRIVNRWILEVKITHAETLTFMIKTIFNKVLDEPHYSEMYVALICSLSSCYPEFPASTFKREFEALVCSEAGAECSSSELQRKRKLANMKFIGHLWRRNFLTLEKLADIMEPLLPSGQGPVEGGRVECACQLLKVVGDLLEAQEPSKARVFVDRLTHLWQSTGALCKRVSFVVQEILEMQANGWQNRRDRERAVTIEEVRRGAPRGGPPEALQPSALVAAAAAAAAGAERGGREPRGSASGARSPVAQDVDLRASAEVTPPCRSGRPLELSTSPGPAGGPPPEETGAEAELVCPSAAPGGGAAPKKVGVECSALEHSAVRRLLCYFAEDGDAEHLVWDWSWAGLASAGGDGGEQAARFLLDFGMSGGAEDDQVKCVDAAIALISSKALSWVAFMRALKPYLRPRKDVLLDRPSADRFLSMLVARLLLGSQCCSSYDPRLLLEAIPKAQDMQDCNRDAVWNLLLRVLQWVCESAGPESARKVAQRQEMNAALRAAGRGEQQPNGTLSRRELQQRLKVLGLVPADGQHAATDAAAMVGPWQ